MQAGTLPRKEFVFGGHFDEELFAEIREKKLATLLVREIVETEPQWLKWDFEEAQTKIDLADMVLEQLVTETIGFLNTKDKKSGNNEENKVKQIKEWRTEVLYYPFESKRRPSYHPNCVPHFPFESRFVIILFKFIK